MNVSPSPAGHLFFDRLEKFVFKKKLDRNFQISDFKIFRFQIPKFSDFRFRNFSVEIINIFKKSIFRFFKNFENVNNFNSKFSKFPISKFFDLKFFDFRSRKISISLSYFLIFFFLNRGTLIPRFIFFEQFST